MKQIVIGFLVVFFSTLLLSKNQTSSYVNNRRGIHALQNQQFNMALTRFEAALSQVSDSGESFYNLGNTFFLQGKLDQSIQAYGQALSLIPSNFKDKVYTNLGLAFLKKREMANAKAQFIQALQLNSKNLIAKRGLTIVLTHLRNQNNRDDGRSEDVAEDISLYQFLNMIEQHEKNNMIPSNVRQHIKTPQWIEHSW